MLVRYLFLYSAMIGVCKCVWLNISRGAQNGNDMFTNLDYTATCPRTSDDGAFWCQSRNGRCSNRGCCVCVCEWSFSTFQVNTTPTASRCVGNRAIRTFAGCNQSWFVSVGLGNPLLTFDLSKSGVRGIEIQDLFSKANCKLKDVKYLSQEIWNEIPSKEAKSFSVDMSKSWPHVKLEWTGQLPSTYFGDILKVNAECEHGKYKRTFCVVFKAKGSITYDVQIPTRQPATTTTVTSTTILTVMSNTVTTVTLAATRRTTSVAKTQSSTLKRTTARTVIVPSTENNSTTSGEESTSGAQTEEISTMTKHTYSGNKASKKDEKIEGGAISNTMIIITVCVAAAICVAVISLTVWLFCQRRRRKDAAHFDPTTTGTAAALPLINLWHAVGDLLQNPTVRSQDHLPMPGLLRNPVYAAEPQQRDVVDNGTRKAGPNLLLENPCASSGRSSAAQENTYDNMEQKRARGGGAELEDETLLYQGLVGQETPHFAVATNVSLYQSLKPDVVLYEPLRKNITLDESPEEGPKYLQLLNPDESRPHSPPAVISTSPLTQWALLPWTSTSHPNMRTMLTWTSLEKGPRVELRK